ncbi:hypothetical protein B566_EDAN011631, partial [Ephemera danica]
MHILCKKIKVPQQRIVCARAPSFTREFRVLHASSHVLMPNTGAGLSHARGILDSLKKSRGCDVVRLVQVRFVMGARTTLAELLALRLHQFEDEVRSIVEQAVKERGMERVLRDLEATWTAMEFEREILHGCQVQLQNLMSSKYIAFFLSEVSGWQTRLSNADQVITIWFEVQRTWLHLQSIFLASEDIRLQLPEDSARFDQVDHDFRVQLQNLMSSKYIAFFLSEVSGWQTRLSNADQVITIWFEVQRTWLHLQSIFLASEDIRLQLPEDSARFDQVDHDFRVLLEAMPARVVEATNQVGLFEQLEALQAKLTLCEKALAEYLETKRLAFPRFYFVSSADLLDILSNGNQPALVARHLTKLFDSLAQLAFRDDGPGTSKEVALGMFAKDGEYVAFPTECECLGPVEVWLGRLEAHMRNTLRGYLGEAVVAYEEKPRDQWLFDYPAQVSQLNTLIGLLLGELTRQQRQKVMTVCTVDVHSRDVVSRLVQLRVESAQAFQWQSQLRHRWDEVASDCFVNICDAQFRYAHEYLGNTPRLVITPLTDRCYITLTQSLHLVMGGAPAGPAGTGKTETTKDLGRALGMMVYVFNCSEQMDYQDAIREKRDRFVFQGDEIALVPSVGIFVTMNPGYAGRTELPENLKALFRPCAMVVPDFELICEIMLVAEGFQEARVLARKFITLYSLCRELLSKQDHYDWGLRAIKSVLVVAGSLKRGDRERPEEQVLMRALRDFNIPKIVADDVPVFMGLIGDLFPALDVPRKRDPEFERAVKQAAADLHLQPEDGFILKVVQLEELLQVRHSVFVVGGAGAGKTQVWRTLYKTYANMKRRPIVADLNPKAVTNDDLFGVINPATREWKDGLLSSIMREQANLAGDGPRWIVLDGDIDPMWIESLNTVMDDNKVLTLASNERIALTPTMRLLFEISTLRTATPATVSRAGILFLNPHDLGWSPCVEMARGGRFRQVTPVTPGAAVQTLCRLLGCLLCPAATPADCPTEWYELYFVFACTWAFGAALLPDQATEFSKWWISEFKSVRFPTDSSVFSVYIDPETKKLVPWRERVPHFELDPDVPLLATLVATSETTRLRYFMDLLMAERTPLMLVGGSGCGKSLLVSDRLAALPESHLVANVPFNYYTTAEMLQKVLEKPLEKKAGRNYGPPGSKTLVDPYGTVQPHTLLRQHLDYGHWYDRNKLTLKDIHNTQYVACMNPTAGSFTINTRLLRHFSVFALSFPETEAVEFIYRSILTQHVTSPQHQFGPGVMRAVPAVVDAALGLHARASQMFLPTATNAGESLQSGEDLARLWLHEAQRVYGDKMADERDSDTFNKLLTDVAKKYFEDMDEATLMARPNLYCHFAGGLGEARYLPVTEWDVLGRLLREALANYNELVAAMELSPRGNALLVGVGGSGKQSLARLAAFISGLEADLAALYLKAGLKNVGTVFLMTDAQVADEKFLVLINDLLASGEVPELFADDEVDNIVSSLRNEVVLCFSPVGSTLRVRSRKFPALTGCSCIDWFHEWPQEALVSVSKRFLNDLEVLAIALYSKLLREKHSELRARIARLENGLEKLRSTAAQVDGLKARLAQQEIEVQQKNEAADRLIHIVGVETEKVSKEKAVANKEEAKVALIAREVSKKQQDCEEDLEKAEPALVAAQEALNTLNKIMMGKVDQFLDALVNYKKEEIAPDVIKAIQPYLKDKEFKPDLIRSKSAAAAGLCAWVINIIKFYEVFCEVEPKRVALAEANAELAAAQEKLRCVKAQIENLEAQLAKLTAEFETATLEKLRCQQEADDTNRTIELANRLVTGLASEKPPIPITDDLDPLALLTDDAQVATWNNEALAAGETVLFENIGESVDAVLDPLLGRNLIKKGRAIRIGDKEVEFKPEFRLILHTKLANPHYKPEMQAQTTLVDFTVTRDGLEEQLLAEVNEFKIKLKALEDALLLRLSSAGGDLLSDRALVENLETTKRTAAEISRKVAEGKVTAKRIDEARELYRPAAQRAALLYFKAIERAPAAENVTIRVQNLIDCITHSVYLYTTRGLFECDKLIFTAQMAFQILLMSGDIIPAELDTLLRFPTTPNLTSPNLDRDIEASPLRWKKFVENKTPEREKFPQEWKSKVDVQRLCMMRALRPDRMTHAVSVFIEEKLGAKYVQRHSVNFEESFEETGPATPVFFILSPGVNPLKDVEELGRKLGFSSRRGNFHSVSLGQGQESVAERAMAVAAKEGHWVVLQLGENAHQQYRVFMSAEPAPTPDAHILPQ